MVWGEKAKRLSMRAAGNRPHGEYETIYVPRHTIDRATGQIKKNLPMKAKMIYVKGNLEKLKGTKLLSSNENKALREKMARKKVVRQPKKKANAPANAPKKAIGPKAKRVCVGCGKENHWGSKCPFKGMMCNLKKKPSPPKERPPSPPKVARAPPQNKPKRRYIPKNKNAPKPTVAERMMEKMRKMKRSARKSVL